jgi:hypothetical protein
VPGNAFAGRSSGHGAARGACASGETQGFSEPSIR